ncbi:hypothetical protein [Methylobacterium hispanicum]|nr:hypothetical protein [Methylobacterium hispanicum]
MMLAAICWPTPAISPCRASLFCRDVSASLRAVPMTSETTVTAR